MKTIRQLLRQPMKTLAGITLVALAVAVLTVCAGQSFAAAASQARLDRTFISMALPNVDSEFHFVQQNDGTLSLEKSSANYSAEADAWALEFARDNPDIVKAVGEPGLVSAYIPALEPIHFEEDYRVVLQDANNNAPYDRALVEFTLTQWLLYGAGEDYAVVDGQKTDLPETDETEMIPDRILLIGTVEQVIGLQPGFADPAGFTAEITVVLPEDGEYDVEFVEGQRYLAYVIDYRDQDYYLRAWLARYKKGLDYQQAFAPDDLVWIPEEDRSRDIVAKLRYNGNNYTGLNASLAECFRKITGRAAAQGGVYSNLSILPLTGTAEEFLQSAEGAAWQEALSDLEINNHAFPVVGIDAMEEISDFSRNKMQIVEGREFTPEELESGAAVCLISETLARANGLKVGDVICPRLYSADPDLPRQMLPNVQPAAAYYYAPTTDLADVREYTIAGLYRCEQEWSESSENPYAFTPNTIFVPKQSVDVGMAYGSTGFFRSFLVHNGKLDDFQAAAVEAGFVEQFYMTDNGYSTVEPAMESYREIADQALTVGVVVYCIVAALYLLLFPGRLGSVSDTMGSLGAPRLHRVRFVVESALVVLLPGALLGMGLGMLLWQSVVEALAADAAALLAIEMDPVVLCGIGLTALSVLLALSALLAVPVTADRTLHRKRKR